MVSIRIDWPAVGREMFIRSLFFLPQASSISLERWLRGRSEFGKLQQGNCIVVSFPNSGRSWLQVLLSRYYQLRQEAAARSLIDLDHLSRRHTSVPRFHFTHDNYLRDYTGHGPSKTMYNDKPVILLVRDPADVAVSQYHQWKHRMSRRKIVINNYPRDPDISPFDFVARPDGSLCRIITFMNEWARGLAELEFVLVVKYEELCADTERTVRNILGFVDTAVSPEQLRSAIDFASLPNMRKLEEKGNRLLRSGRFAFSRASSSNSYKARRGAVGGYRNDFSGEQIAAIDQIINDQLSPIFRYQRHTEPESADALDGLSRVSATDRMSPQMETGPAALLSSRRAAWP